MQALEAVMRARELLQTLTPLRRDCGDVCGAACCAPDEDGQGGMLLFPGEEALYQPLPAGFSLRQDDGVLPGMLLLICGGVCDRALRPPCVRCARAACAAWMRPLPRRCCKARAF